MKSIIGIIGLCLAIGTVDNPNDWSLFVTALGVMMSALLMGG